MPLVPSWAVAHLPCKQWMYVPCSACKLCVHNHTSSNCHALSVPHRAFCMVHQRRVTRGLGRPYPITFGVRKGTRCRLQTRSFAPHSCQCINEFRPPGLAIEKIASAPKCVSFLWWVKQKHCPLQGPSRACHGMQYSADGHVKISGTFASARRSRRKNRERETKGTSKEAAGAQPQARK